MTGDPFPALPRRSLRKVTLLIILAAVLPLFILGVLAINQTRSLRSEAALEEVARMRELLTEAHDQWFLAAQDTFQLLARPLRGANREACAAILADALESTTGFDIFLLAEPNGDVICAPSLDNARINLADRDYFQRVMRSGGFAVGDYLIGRVSGNPSLPMAMPILSADNRVEAVIVAGKRPDWLEARVRREGGLPPSTQVTLIDSEGTVFVRSNGDTATGQTLADRDLLHTVLAQRNGVIEREAASGMNTIAAFGPVGSVADDIYLIIEVPRDSLFAPIATDFIFWLAGILIASTLAALAAFALLERALVRPLTQLTDGLGQVAAGDLEWRTPAQPTVRELALLGRQADTMAAALQARAEEAAQREAELARSNRELQDFAYIASHDLQEPLRKIASFGNLLVKRCGDDLSEDGKTYVGFMVSGAARLQTLINELLEYSRIGRQDTAIAPVPLAGVVADVLVDLSLTITESGAEVVTGDRLPTVFHDRGRLHQVLLNLVGNAIKYRDPARPLVIHIDGDDGAAAEDGAPWIRISDTGRGFPSDKAEEAFVPFRRLVGRTDVEGSGMGLAICRKIITHYGGRITASSTPDAGSAFTIRFARNPRPVGDKPNA